MKLLLQQACRASNEKNGENAHVAAYDAVAAVFSSAGAKRWEKTALLGIRVWSTEHILKDGLALDTSYGVLDPWQLLEQNAVFGILSLHTNRNDVVERFR